MFYCFWDVQVYRVKPPLSFQVVHILLIHWVIAIFLIPRSTAQPDVCDPIYFWGSIEKPWKNQVQGTVQRLIDAGFNVGALAF
jgi:hypothetical protein